MSEATNETVETVETDRTDNSAETTDTETTETESPATETTEPEFTADQLDEFGQMTLSRLVENIDKLNKVNEERKQLSSDPAEVQKSLYESLVAGNMPDGITVDEKVWTQYLKAVEFVNKTTAYFDTVADEVAKKRVAENTDAERVTALTTEAESLEKIIKAGRNLFLTENPQAANLVPAVKGIKSGSTSTGDGRGSGGKKLRGFTVAVNGETATLPNSEGKQTSSFAAGAKVLGIPTAELQRAFFAALDANDDNYQEKIAALTSPVEMTVKNKASEDQKVTITRN